MPSHRSYSGWCVPADQSGLIELRFAVLRPANDRTDISAASGGFVVRGRGPRDDDGADFDGLVFGRHISPGVSFIWGRSIMCGAEVSRDLIYCWWGSM